jgi:hypothetical protein
VDYRRSIAPPHPNRSNGRGSGSRGAALASRLRAAFSGRCQIIEAAIWDRVTKLAVHGDQPSGYEMRKLANEW